MTVSYVENADNKDAEAIAKTALVPAHHPCIGMLKLYNLLISPYLIKTMWRDFSLGSLKDEVRESVGDKLDNLLISGLTILNKNKVTWLISRFT